MDCVCTDGWLCGGRGPARPFCVERQTANTNILGNVVREAIANESICHIDPEPRRGVGNTHTMHFMFKVFTLWFFMLFGFSGFLILILFVHKDILSAML